MRLWHKKLISVLPRQQLISQWRECCLIASLLATDHTPNHVLVNPILDYPCEHFEKYCSLVYQTMVDAGYKPTPEVIRRLEMNLRSWEIYSEEGLPWYISVTGPTEWWSIDDEDLFADWHNDRYLTQCYYNLQEKWDRGGIPFDEWADVKNHYILLGGEDGGS